MEQAKNDFNFSLCISGFIQDKATRLGWDAAPEGEGLSWNLYALAASLAGGDAILN
ncbi:hypothetical protein [Leptolyngbya sp. 7M]|uniref:hypothetical protein n=1 Tax=Leptolyngbya sp. 7M TaxID=2812896 RepID=UPI001B8D1147|nr:hypothetical protein [Leptolyngbya sp. 7M]QYO63376.1 hypothetical protein JVX88_26210 [Leptolyngbya sp. 7M]